MYSCEPATAFGQLLVDAVRENRVAGALVGGVLLDQLVEGALGVEHHRPELAVDSPRPPDAPRCPALAGRASWPAAARGRSSRTATLRPRAAIPSAIAAAVVVLPTPPEPAQIAIRLSSSSRATLTAPRSSSAARRSTESQIELGLEQVRQRDRLMTELLGAAARAARAGCARGGARTAPPSARPPRRGDPFALARPVRRGRPRYR